MSVNRAHAARKHLVKLKPGVWVRQNAAGDNLCKIPHCKSPPASETPEHRGMCLKHLEKVADGRPKCQKCRVSWCVEPYADGMCEACHPNYRELTPHESLVLEEIRKGATPVKAMQTAMGPGTKPAAAAKAMSRMSKSAKMARRIRRALEANGITDAVIFGKLRENIDAKKHVYNNEGELVAEVPDVRASNQTIEILLKVQGAFPSRTVSAADKKPQQMNIAVAMLPAVEPRKPDAPIYTLPPSKRIGSGGGEE